MGKMTVTPTFEGNPGLKKLMVSIGEQLREMRLGFGWSQQEFYKLYGVNSNTSSRLENAKSPNVTIWTIWRWADLLGYEMRVTFVKKRSNPRAGRPRDAQAVAQQEAPDGAGLSPGNPGGDGVDGRGPGPDQAR